MLAIISFIFHKFAVTNLCNVRCRNVEADGLNETLLLHIEEMNDLRRRDYGNDDSLLSQTITFLRFPLTAAVVLIHSTFDRVIVNGVTLVDVGNHPVYTFVKTLFADGFAHVAVPTFFFISGFLFFYRKEFSLQTYKDKLAGRFTSLFIPYVFWNVVVILLRVLTQMLLPEMTSGGKKMFADYGPSDWLKCFWTFEGMDMPVCYPFWFIRNLMVMVVLSPLIYFLVKRLGLLFPAVVCILWITGLAEGGTGPWAADGLMFFSFGAYYSVFGKNFVTEFRRIPLKAAVAAYLVLVALRMYLVVTDCDWAVTVHEISVVVGVVTVIRVTSRLLENGKAHTAGLLASGAFFIYAYHCMPVMLFTKLWAKFVPVSDAAMIAGMFVIATALILLGLVLYRCCERFFPAVTIIITGGHGYKTDNKQ